MQEDDQKMINLATAVRRTLGDLAAGSEGDRPGSGAPSPRQPLSNRRRVLGRSRFKLAKRLLDRWSGHRSFPPAYWMAEAGSRSDRGTRQLSPAQPTTPQNADGARPSSSAMGSQPPDPIPIVGGGGRQAVG